MKAVTFLLIFHVSAIVALAASPEDWPTYNHDVAGWRFNAEEKILSPANVGKLVEKWRFPAADSKETIGVVHATPTVVDGEVYFGTGTFPAFYKLDANGKLKWVYRNPVRPAVMPPTADGFLGDKLGSTVRDAGIMSSALVAAGAVYFADTGGWVYCLDAGTGAERWKLDMRAPSFPDVHPNNLTLCSPILADGKIVIGGGTLEQLYAGTKAYPGSTGRGFMMALDPKSGAVLWKYNVGEKPQKLDPPVTVMNDWGSTTYTHGPATSSVWCTPSFDEETKSIFFGTDVNTAPRQPTPDNPKLSTEDSDAIVCLDVATGQRKWRTQIYPGDQWNNEMRGWDSKTGLYKDCSIGDTPKVFRIEVDGQPTKVVGAGCKDGAFYILRADTGQIVKHTPVYTGPPTEPPAAHDSRMLALPSPIGGLQTGCATDGRTIFTNGIDAVRVTTQADRFSPDQVPTGGRVTATSVDLATELWRHERPKVSATAGPPENPVHYERGDIVGSGIALGNGVAYFTAAGSEKLVALDMATGAVLREIEIGPVFCGPSLSHGRVYVGGGNTVFSGGERRIPGAPKPALSIERRSGGLFPLQIIGRVCCFGLPDEDKTGGRQGRNIQHLPLLQSRICVNLGVEVSKRIGWNGARQRFGVLRLSAAFGLSPANCQSLSAAQFRNTILPRLPRAARSRVRKVDAYAQSQDRDAPRSRDATSRLRPADYARASQHPMDSAAVPMARTRRSLVNNIAGRPAQRAPTFMACSAEPKPDAGSEPAAATPAPRRAAPPLPDDVEKRVVTIWSNGTRMAGNLYLPKTRQPDEKLPAVVLCAGTGGTKEQTGSRLGPILAQHGYIALAFDYRGWGASESQLMAVEPQPKPDASNEMTIKVKALRGQMNYTDQTEDIRAAISFIAGEPSVDVKRIGLWGTSYGGGLVTWVTGNDPRVKCVAAQVPGMGSNAPGMVAYGYSVATKQARGDIEPVPIETGKLTGALARYKEMRWNPTRNLGFNAAEAAAKITVPALFVVAEKEELASNDTVERIRQDLIKRGVPSDIYVLKGATHYSVYAEAFEEATRVELEWYDEHLKK